VVANQKKNTTLRELTLHFPHGPTTASPSLTSICDLPLLRRLSLRGHGVDATGLETLLLSDTTKITELEIHGSYEALPIVGFPRILRALGRRPTLTEVGLRRCPLGCDARLLRLALSNIPSLHSLVLTDGTLRSTDLAELAPALYDNTSIKVLDMSKNDLFDTESASILRDILRRNKTMTSIDLSMNRFGQTNGAVECIADGLGSNSTLLKINLSSCSLRHGGVFTLGQSLRSHNTTLQKLSLGTNSITSTGVGLLLEAMEESCNITDLDLQSNNTIGNEGASLIAMTLENNLLPDLTRLSLSSCDVGNDGFVALMSALEQNTSLLQLDLRDNHAISEQISERAFLALADSLPEIKVLQRFGFNWCPGLASAIPLLMEGLRKNTSLFRFHVTDCTPSSVPPTPKETVRCAGDWMQEMERLGYRNRFLPLTRAPKDRLPPRGVWPHALARVATHPDVIFEGLRSKPSLVPPEDTYGKEAAKDTGVPKKRKRGDE
jgi:Ran GTPase-activating protein (RanGAP) involved in mRNA processing and transport